MRGARRRVRAAGHGTGHRAESGRFDGDDRPRRDRASFGHLHTSSASLQSSRLPHHPAVRDGRPGAHRRRRGDVSPRTARAGGIRLPDRPRCRPSGRTDSGRRGHEPVRHQPVRREGGAHRHPIDRRGAGARAALQAAPDPTQTLPVANDLVDRCGCHHDSGRLGRHRPADRGRRLGDHDRAQFRVVRHCGQLLPLVERRRGALCTLPAAVVVVHRHQPGAAVAAATRCRTGCGDLVRAEPRCARRGVAGPVPHYPGAGGRGNLLSRRVVTVQFRCATRSLCRAWCYHGTCTCVAVAEAGRPGLGGAGGRAHRADQPDRGICRRAAGGIRAANVPHPAGRFAGWTGSRRADRFTVLRWRRWCHDDLRRSDVVGVPHGNGMAHVLRSGSAVVSRAGPVLLSAQW